MGQHEDRFRDLVLEQYEEVWNKENYDYADETVHAGVQRPSADAVLRRRPDRARRR